METVDQELLRWGAKQRLEFIEFRLYWDGAVNRADITRQFGVSVPQASSDLSAYQRIAPENTRYDTRVKKYLPTEEFTPRLIKPNADRYLAQLKAIADHVIHLDDTWITDAPPADAMPIPYRKVDPAMLKRFISCIKQKQSIEIFYQSMNSAWPEIIWRRITPHAFGYDGLRWHIRAYCHLKNDFKDFILSRCLEARDETLSTISADSDLDWATYFTVILKPNPSFTPSQQKVIEKDYDMHDGQLAVRIRCALLYYFNKRLRLDVRDDNPKATPLVVENNIEFQKALGAAERSASGVSKA